MRLGPHLRRLDRLARRLAAHRDSRQATAGQAMVIFALFLLVLVGFVALSIDAGYIMAERRQAQNAADAGALAAAKSLFQNRTGEISSAGQTYAQTNLGGTGNTISVSWPPASGYYAGNDDYVQVSVTSPVEQFFVGAIYSGAWQVSASATAGVEREPGDYALIALERDASPGIYQNGNTGIVITGGNASAMSNGSISGNSNSSFVVPSTGYIDAHDGITIGQTTDPGRVRPDRPYAEDPIVEAGYSAPTPPPPALAINPLPNCSANCVLTPGLYRNGSLTIRRTARLTPGVYYFQNFDLLLQNTNSRIESIAPGVTLYFDRDSLFDPKNGEVVIRGPSGQPWNNAPPGIAFWYAACNNLDFQGNGQVFFEGLFYAPCSDVTLHGNPGSETINGQIFVNTLDVRGTSDVRLAYRRLVDTFMPWIYLVE